MEKNNVEKNLEKIETLSIDILENVQIVFEICFQNYAAAVMKNIFR